MWNNLSDGEKQPYNNKAAKLKEKYEKVRLFLTCASSIPALALMCFCSIDLAKVAPVQWMSPACRPVLIACFVYVGQGRLESR